MLAGPEVSIAPDRLPGGHRPNLSRLSPKAVHDHSYAPAAPAPRFAVSNDHNCVLAACMDSTIRLLDRADGDLLAEYTGRQGAAVAGKTHLVGMRIHLGWKARSLG